MSRVASYRYYAAECLALAERALGETDRASLIQMAAIWHELAEKMRKYTDEPDGELGGVDLTKVIAP